MSTSDHLAFFTELERLEAAYHAAKANLGPKGLTDPKDAAIFRAASQELADWRRDIKILAGRPMVSGAATGAE